MYTFYIDTIIYPINNLLNNNYMILTRCFFAADGGLLVPL